MHDALLNIYTIPMLSQVCYLPMFISAFSLISFPEETYSIEVIHKWRNHIPTYIRTE